jgi:hypothetical protein
MSELNPSNVPPVRNIEWAHAGKIGCSFRQRQKLEELLSWEGIKAPDLFGDGFISISYLSRWAAHWAIEMLESRIEAKAIQEAREEFLEAEEQELKRNMGLILRQIMAEHHA